MSAKKNRSVCSLLRRLCSARISIARRSMPLLSSDFVITVSLIKEGAAVDGRPRVVRVPLEHLQNQRLPLVVSLVTAGARDSSAEDSFPVDGKDQDVSRCKRAEAPRLDAFAIFEEAKPRHGRGPFPEAGLSPAGRRSLRRDEENGCPHPIAGARQDPFQLRDRRSRASASRVGEHEDRSFSG